MMGTPPGTVKYQPADDRTMAAPEFPVPEHRSRLLEGMAVAVAQKGYAAVTIADIVREASVSRRTFYEHFGSKAECLAVS